MFSPQILYTITFAGVMACWFLFVVAFMFRKRTHASGERKRDNRARTGILFEAAGYSIIWMLRRNHPLLIEGAGSIVGILITIIIVALAICSVLLVVSALKTLGKQWAIAARVVENHELVTDGPYNIVRNPIYSGMFGMLIATGCAVSTWYAVVIASVIFWYGTMIRIKVEENLLRETFGEKFDDYTKRVPALLPKLF